MRNFALIFVLFLLPIIGNAQGIVDLKSGLSASYPFNGDAKDESGNHNDGDVQGASLTSDRFGNPNSAYYFDGNSQIVLPMNTPLHSSDFTIAVWFYLSKDAQDSYCLPLSKGAKDVWDYLVISRTTFLMGGGGNTDYLSYRTNLQSERWYQFVAVRKDGVTNVYLNNELQGTMTKRIDISNTFNWIIGSQNNPEDVHFFKGKIDDVQIYKKALSSDQLTALFHQTLSHPIAAMIDTVSFDNQTVNFGKTFILPILNAGINRSSAVLAAQFDFNYDASSIRYVGYSMDSTIFTKATAFVNATQSGKLSIAIAGKDSVFGAGKIINLKFNAIKTGNCTPFITNFLYDTDSLKNLHNGKLHILDKYGDIDGNHTVQAFDAALVLKHSVENDTILNKGITTWSRELISVADVDGLNGATAYDASLILQKVSGLITSFPVESQLKRLNSPSATVNAKLVDGYLQFTCTGELYGLNISIDNVADQFGAAVLTGADVCSAVNTSTSSYKIGLASATPISGAEPFLSVPLKGTLKSDVVLNMIVNSDDHQVNIGTVTGIDQIENNIFSLYPNPAQTILSISGLTEVTKICIVDVNGRVVDTLSTTKDINISNLEKGAYFIRVISKKGMVQKLFIKQ